MTNLKLKDTLSLRKLLVISIVSYMVIILIGSVSLFFDSNPWFDEITVIISLGIGLVLFFAIRFSEKYLFQQIAVICFFFIVFLLPRIVTYLFMPAIVEWPFGDDINAETVNAGLLYVLIGTLLFIIGMIIADKFFRPYLPLSSAVVWDDSYYSTKALVTLFLIVLAFTFYVQVGVGISPYGKMRVENNNALFQLVKSVFEFDAAFFLVFSTLLFRNIIENKSKWISVIMVAFCYIFITGLAGSRSAILRIMTALTISFIVISDNFHFRIVKLCMTMFPLVMVGLMVFPLATLSRVITFRKHHNYTFSFEYTVTEMFDFQGLESVISSVLNRLGWVLDYAVLIVTQEGDPAANEKYMNLLYPTKNIINILLPGNPFPEAKIMTSRVIDVIYRGSQEPSMYSRYFSEFWTLWGLGYALFGWIEGLLVISFIGFIIYSLYALIIIGFSGFRQFYLRIWLLFYVVMGIVGNMGFDSAFTTIFFGLLQFTALHFALFIVQFFYGLFDGFSKQTVKCYHRRPPSFFHRCKLHPLG